MHADVDDLVVSVRACVGDDQVSQERVSLGLRPALRALCTLRRAALVRAARDVVRSGRDPGMELHDLGRVTPPGRYRDALAEVCRHTRSHGLDTVTAAAVMAAQAADELVIEALCLVAGITYNELRERAASTLPVKPGNRWSQPQIEAAFAVIDSFVRGTVVQTVPDDAIVRRPAELLLAADGQGGWQRIQAMSSAGIPYELLLTQRAVGSAWGAHQNSTATTVQKGVINDICQRLSQMLPGRTGASEQTWSNH